MDGRETIVGEVSKNWSSNGSRGADVAEDPIAVQFEDLIEANRQRRRYLVSWKLTTVSIQDAIVETIVAVFET